MTPRMVLVYDDGCSTELQYTIQYTKSVKELPSHREQTRPDQPLNGATPVQIAAVKPTNRWVNTRRTHYMYGAPSAHYVLRDARRGRGRENTGLP